MGPKELIKISEMAGLHGISRQTLILYDKNGLLKPVTVSESGYRYYSVDQIPRLRQICLLKEMGVPLSEIRACLDDCSVDAMRGLLARRRASIRSQIETLSRQAEEIEQLDEVYVDAAGKEERIGAPRIVDLPERRALFAPYPSADMDPRKLHLTLMDAWGRLLDAGGVPSQGFGSLLDARDLSGARPLEHAGSIVVLPRELPIDEDELVTLPAGRYVCMYKYAMPYDIEPVRELLNWMADQGLRPAGPIVDSCLLDALFYRDGRAEDFCRLEVLLAADDR